MLELLVLAALSYIVWKFKGKSTPKPQPKLWDTTQNTNTTVDVANKPNVKVEHNKQSHLATENERKLRFALQKALPSDYIIHSQVSLMALVTPVNFKHNSRTWAKRMDFVITDKATKVLAVIELDDSTHNWKKRQERDLYVNEALEGHHKLVRFSTKRFYEPSEIAKVLERETEIKCNSFDEVLYNKTLKTDP
ncbi:DUF2726 domain-containing protein [Vibrio fluvialis]|uniref:DUF2726 domain-containing protein n=1 Tax=Vibrio fluvialis TaxID=676 RepID=UPI001EEC1B3D|nr:DUF2726 domain-containing protein [Vibrio fluvialis]MCG6348463.1 DUF2726 domain-containing protein [Vibrio fluvialis]